MLSLGNYLSQSHRPHDERQAGRRRAGGPRGDPFSPCLGERISSIATRLILLVSARVFLPPPPSSNDLFLSFLLGISGNRRRERFTFKVNSRRFRCQFIGVISMAARFVADIAAPALLGCTLVTLDLAFSRSFSAASPLSPHFDPSFSAPFSSLM